MHVPWLPESKINLVSMKVAFSGFKASTTVVCIKIFSRKEINPDSSESAFSLFFDTEMVLKNFCKQRNRWCSLLSSQWTLWLLLANFLYWWYWLKQRYLLRIHLELLRFLTLYTQMISIKIYVCTLLVFSLFDNDVSTTESKKLDDFGNRGVWNVSLVGICNILT